MLFAQIPNPSDIADVSGKLTEYGIVAILLFILLLVLGGCGVFALLIYRQLFGTSHTEGLVQKAFVKHETFLDRLTTSIEHQGRLSETSVETSRKIESTVNKLFEFVRRTDSNVDDVVRAYRSHIRILRTMADKIGILNDVESHLMSLEELFPVEPRRNVN